MDWIPWNPLPTNIHKKYFFNIHHIFHQQIYVGSTIIIELRKGGNKMYECRC